MGSGSRELAERVLRESGREGVRQEGRSEPREGREREGLRRGSSERGSEALRGRE